MKRIVEETLENGKVRYIVENKTILFGWHTDTIYDAERDMHFSAIFDSLEEAESYMGKGNQVIKRVVVEKY